MSFKKKIDDASSIADLKKILMDLYYKLDEMQVERRVVLAPGAQGKLYRGGIIGREKVERIWENLHDKPGFATTVHEIARMVGLSESVVQRCLYTLLAEGRAKRQARNTKGKVNWEYYRLNVPNQEIYMPFKPFDAEALRKILPQNELEALSISEIASRMRGSPSSIRRKVKQLEKAGEIQAVAAFDDMHRPVSKYHLVQ
jgi:predicted transcriptional regulator